MLVYFVIFSISKALTFFSSSENTEMVAHLTGRGTVQNENTNIDIYDKEIITVAVYSNPSTLRRGIVGTLLPRIPALPLWRSMPRRPEECLLAVSSSWPVWRASAAASFFTACSAPLWQTPRDSLPISGLRTLPLSFSQSISVSQILTQRFRLRSVPLRSTLKQRQWLPVVM